MMSPTKRRIYSRFGTSVITYWVYHGIANTMRQEGATEAVTGPKKVLFLITKATWGGAQRYVYDLATNLPKEQFEVVVAYGQPGKLSEDLTTAGIRTIPIPALSRDVAIASD